MTIISTLIKRNVLFNHSLKGLESEKFIYIATEYVTPLSTYLENITDMEESQMAISWGLHQVVNGLSFLINQGILVNFEIFTMMVDNNF